MLPGGPGHPSRPDGCASAGTGVGWQARVSLRLGLRVGPASACSERRCRGRGVHGGLLLGGRGWVTDAGPALTRRSRGACQRRRAWLPRTEPECSLAVFEAEMRNGSSCVCTAAPRPREAGPTSPQNAGGFQRGAHRGLGGRGPEADAQAAAAARVPQLLLPVPLGVQLGSRCLDSDCHTGAVPLAPSEDAGISRTTSLCAPSRCLWA